MFRPHITLATLFATSVLAIASLVAIAPAAHADATTCAAYLEMIRSEETPVGALLHSSVAGVNALERIGELGTPPFTPAEISSLATDHNFQVASDEAGTDLVVELGTKCMY